jgi:hypothetical protein
LWRSIARLCVERSEEAARLPTAAGLVLAGRIAEASMGEFYARLPEKSSRLRFGVVFRLVTAAHAPQAAILFDKFPVIRPLGEALHRGRKNECQRLSGRDRHHIKGQKCTLPSRKGNFRVDGKRALNRLLSVNTRLNAAYVLRDSFGELWSYERDGWARRDGLNRIRSSPR